MAQQWLDERSWATLGDPCPSHRVEDQWQHPWLRIERVVRAVFADRLTRGADERSNRTRAGFVAERRQIADAGWFN